MAESRIGVGVRGRVLPSPPLSFLKTESSFIPAIVLILIEVQDSFAGAGERTSRWVACVSQLERVETANGLGDVQGEERLRESGPRDYGVPRCAVEGLHCWDGFGCIMPKYTSIIPEVEGDCAACGTGQDFRKLSQRTGIPKIQPHLFVPA